MPSLEKLCKKKIIFQKILKFLNFEGSYDILRFMQLTGVYFIVLCPSYEIQTQSVRYNKYKLVKIKLPYSKGCAGCWASKNDIKFGQQTFEIMCDNNKFI